MKRPAVSSRSTGSGQVIIDAVMRCATPANINKVEKSCTQPKK